MYPLAPTKEEFRVEMPRPHIRIRVGASKGGPSRRVPLWWDGGTLTDLAERTLTIHHGRHPFISHALAGGRTLAEVRNAAGHSNVSITSGYLHVEWRIRPLGHCSVEVHLRRIAN